MKTFLKIITSLLLLFNGIGAIYGGMSFMLHPDGSSLKITVDWLKHTPFNDYFIPGIILFIANGLFSILTFITLVFNFKKYPLFVLAQGIILLSWIIIQIFLIQTFHFLHLVLGLLAVFLIILGLLQQQLARSFPNIFGRSNKITV